MILCLANSAAYSRAYFEALAPHLSEAGYDTAFALDSHFGDVVFADGRPLSRAWYFSDFVRRHADELEGWTRRHTGSWQPMFSDFDRFLTLGMPPTLGRDAGLAYHQVGAALDEFFERIFAQARPAAVLYEPVSNSFAWAAHQAALRHGIPFCSLSPSRIPGLVELSVTGALRDHETLAEILRDRQRRISERSWQVARDYLAKIDDMTPDYMRVNGLDQLSLRRKYLDRQKLAHLRRVIRYSRNHREDHRVAYQHGDPLKASIAYVRRSIMRRLRVASVRPLFRADAGDLPYFVYPLHFHPESSTSILAQDYVDELAVIKSIAFRLPVGVRLVVKEHPSAVALQPRSFYRQLDRLPHVRLLAPDVPMKSLIRASLGVITLTSTAGFEAAALGKPVIALGNVFYRYFPNVRHAPDYAAFDEALAWALTRPPTPRDEVLAAVAAYAEFGAPGSFDFRASLGNESALSGVARLVADRLTAIGIRPADARR